VRRIKLELFLDRYNNFDKANINVEHLTLPCFKDKLIAFPVNIIIAKKGQTLQLISLLRCQYRRKKVFLKLPPEVQDIEDVIPTPRSGRRLPSSDIKNHYWHRLTFRVPVKHFGIVRYVERVGSSPLTKGRRHQFM
jgi:hypothetical protein